MERKVFYDEIYEDIIRSIQKFQDDDISERYACFCMITFWITKILFHIIVLSISRTNAVSIKVL